MHRLTKVAPVAITSLSIALLATAAAPPPVAAQEDPGILVSTDWLAAHLDDPDVVLLHVESRRDRYEEGHIPGARFLDIDGLAWDGDPPVRVELRSPAEIEAALEAVGVSDGDHIVVYGANPLLAARAWMTLDVTGLGDRASFLDGGLGAWREEGRAVTTDEASFARGDVTLSPRGDVVVSAEWILERLENPTLALVDARPDDEYTGSDGGMGGMANPGHIPGARQMYWEELVESRPIHRAHPREELMALFQGAGADEGDTVVTYCMVGLRASYSYMIARVLGYDAKFYDGSWHDWGTRDLPTVEGRDPR